MFMLVKRAKEVKDGVSCDWMRMTLADDSLVLGITTVVLVDIHVLLVRLIVML